MREATAWIIELGHGLRAALGSSELLHLIPGPTLFEIPQAPSYCRHVMVWEGAIVPVLDLVFCFTEEPVERSELFVAVISYQERLGDAPQQGALLAAGTPTRVRVSDEQACDLPPHLSSLRRVACSCFLHENEAVPVVDLPFLFSGAAVLGDRVEDANRPRSANGELVSHYLTTAQARGA